MNISDPTKITDLAIIFLAILTVDVTVLGLVRYFPDFFGKPLNDWYTEFGLSAVLSDVLVILIGFVITQLIYSGLRLAWNPFLFIGLLVLVQLIHDVLFYLGVILPLPVGHNAMIDVFKAYAAGGGAKILGGDALLMIFSALVAFIYKSIPTQYVVYSAILVTYTLTYMLYTVPQIRSDPI